MGKFINGWIYVKELKKDLNVDGLLERYDDSSPTFLAEVIEADERATNEFLKISYDLKNVILLLSRGNKTEWRGGYLVKYESIIAMMNRQEFDSL